MQVANLSWRDSAVKCMPKHDSEYEFVTASFDPMRLDAAASAGIQAHAPACVRMRQELDEFFIFVQSCPS